MGWQRRLYSHQEPSNAFRAWTTVLGGAVILIGLVLFLYGARLVNGSASDAVLGSILLVLAIPFFFVGLGVVILAWMRWTNPSL